MKSAPSSKNSKVASLMLLDGMIGDIYLKLSDNLAKMEESNLARKRTTVSLIGNNDKIDKSGLVF